LLCLEPGEAQRIERELRWLALLHSDLRDADVLAASVGRRLDTLPPELVIGPVRQEVAETLGGIRHRASAYAAQQRGSERYACLLETLAHWHERPPVGDAHVATAERLLGATRRRARKRIRALVDDDTQLHEARKAVKRLRHVAEALSPVLPKAADLAHRAKETSAVLGDLRDLAVEVDFLQVMGVRHGSRYGHNGFAYGVLIGQVEAEIQGLRLRQLSNL
jgi:CHAD domain-containing protein